MEYFRVALCILLIPFIILGIAIGVISGVVTIAFKDGKDWILNEARGE